MFRLGSNGSFIVEESSKDILDYLFKGKYYRKKNLYILPPNYETYRKIIMNVPEDRIDPTCYLYPILESQNISPKTKKLYFQVNKNFIEFVRKKPEEITQKDVQSYIQYLIHTNKRISTIKTVYMAIRLFFEKLMGYLNLSDIELPKQEKSIPEVLTRKEVKLLIKNIKSQKHKLIIKIAYSCGLKLSEVLSLTVSDIDFENRAVKVKGKNKRIVPASENLIREIKDYLKDQYLKGSEGSVYLFFSKNKDKPLSARTVEIMFKKALLNAGLSTRYKFSILRDSYIVHLIEKNYCLDTISELTGIKESKLLSKFEFYINLAKKNQIPDMLDFSDVA
ncbi:tyrosine-type recombinase/integrase [Persephonella atlantica]|uniref:Tyrosine-type recombinase/integrase n=1 Tax=Persephonella atlantica TaxID=2699429 RepID=A0ABS1GIA2_9AQUI|nr:tyrosine-type recombinase/integrase [Persephonella atlantica]MBK3332663.1 tyrosine-type recombinase/integrase [Persephonella atlantica]